MLLSIIVPAFNEENLVCLLLEKLLALRFTEGTEREIIVIDDGSSDRTAERIIEFIDSNPEEGLHLLRHEKNLGKGAAVRTGIQASAGDLVIVQDADLEYDPEDIHQIIAPILQGTSDVVYGSRILREKELGRSGFFGLVTGKHPHSYVFAYLGGVAITRFTNLLSGAALTDEPTCYKCFHRKVIKELTIESDDFAWEPEITMKILNQGIQITEIPISYHPRKREQGKKINWRDGVKALRTIWHYR